MKILKIIDKKTQAEVIKECRVKLVGLNITFTNNVVYKIMKLTDEKTLFEIKDRAKMFQEEIFYMIHLYLKESQNNYELLNKDLQTYFTNGQANLFAEIDTEKLKRLPKLKKSFNGLYTEIQDKLKSYESFVNKTLKLADKIQKKYKQKEYKKQNQSNSENLSISNNFNGLDDKVLLQYFKQYENILKRYYNLKQDTDNIPFVNGEVELLVDLGTIKTDSSYGKTKQELENLEDYYYKLFPNDFKDASSKFKRNVVEFSKAVNEFSNKIKFVQNIR